MEIEFFMPMIPPTVTHQEKRITAKNNKPIVYEDERLKDARQKLTAHLSQHRISQPLVGAVRLMVKWCFPIAAKHKHGEYKTTKPDTDNLQKLLKDVMTKLGFWKDDALVCSEIVEKFYSDVPGIYIRLEEI